ncbi:hypothetical protein Lser_V15G07489 [Lactuca serriola]
MEMQSPKVHSLPSTTAGRSESPDDSTNAKLQEATSTLSQISKVIDSVKKKVDADRCVYIMRRMKENQMKLAEITKNHHRLSVERRNLRIINGENIINLLEKRQKDAIDMQDGVDISSEEDEHVSVVLLGSGIPVKNSVRPINLPEMEKLPPYTTWVFMDRNRRMTEDQSVVGRRRIYYDRNGGEALICSDSEEEVIDDEEDKKEFVDSEDTIIRMTIEQLGSTDTVLELLAQRLSRKPCEVKARYEALVNRENKYEDTDFNLNSFLDKDLEAAQDSLDNLFCRRCLIFDCKLHGCSQELIFPAEKNCTWNIKDDENVPCGPHCYLKVQNLEANPATSPMELDTQHTNTLSSPYNIRQHGTLQRNTKSTPNHGSKDTDFPSNSHTDYKYWKTIEKSLFEKGLEIFGRNSCLIARNLLCGLKTCTEVFNVLKCYNNNLSSQVNSITNSQSDSCKVESNNNMIKRSRLLRRRGRIRRFKYTWKSGGTHSMRKRISDKQDLPCRQYNPCGCQSTCGDNCSCLANETTCEKYCGCPKTCKNRFRGCHCAKNQCRSRQCPCFAANRECDPDVCRHCWISCGDGSLGTPSKKGDNYECRNMKLLLKQQQRVLLGRSDVSGWGAFLRNSVAKHEYLGEYTGELISHHEADKRGKIYDRENSSFLFNLNDQYVLDAFRKGDKLKFANHSPNPNCYAKVIMVGGDHRVGIFAKEKIWAGEEVFYDYHYAPDQTPAWAKKPGESGPKREDMASSSGRAKKRA